MERSHRLSGWNITIMVVAISIALFGAPVAYAAARQDVVIRGSGTAYAHVLPTGALKVGSGTTPLEVNGSVAVTGAVKPAPPGWPVAFHLTDALPGTACSGTTYSIARGTRLYLTTISVTADTDNSGLVTSHLFAPGLATLQVPLQLALSGGGTWEWTGLQTVNIVLPGPTTVSFCTTSFVAGKDTGDAWVHGYLLS